MYIININVLVFFYIIILNINNKYIILNNLINLLNKNKNKFKK